MKLRRKCVPYVLMVWCGDGVSEPVCIPSILLQDTLPLPFTLTAKRVAHCYGIFKLQINCVVEDDKVGTDFLEESITAFDSHVQSVDIIAFNKI